MPYDHLTPPQPGFFREGILNSFPDRKECIEFLNKFYQCLLAFSVPHKVRKLVVAGPRDSGKTSWATIFHRLIPADSIASLTNEKQFSASMLDNHTQLVLVDEWCAVNMDSDLAKCILQGGWMVTAVKHGLPRRIVNNSPFYITTNDLPDFVKDDENVKRRIQVFDTTSLPRTLPGVDRWIYDNAMDCVAWIASELNTNRHLIPEEELWYENSEEHPLIISPNEGEALFKSDEVSTISLRDFRDLESDDDDDTTAPTIHQCFASEARSRRLRRKRRACRQLQLSSSTEDESPGTSQRARFIDDALATDEINEETRDSGLLSVNDESNDKSNRDPLNSEDEHGVINRDPHTSTEPQENPDGDNREQSVDPPSTCSTMLGITEAEGGWTLNNTEYMAKVACLIKYEMCNHVTRAEVHTFTGRRSRAETMRARRDREFWTVADPKLDVWMLLTGKTRPVFDLSLFVRNYPDIFTELEKLRKIANVFVLPSRCPVAKQIAGGKSAENDEEVEDVPSGSYWTTIKSWRPW